MIKDGAKHNTTQTMEVTEGGIKTLIRNALMIAGKEMGDTGDHWPVIKNTITDIMKDWKALEVERHVHAETKKHLYKNLADMEATLKTCDAEVQAEVGPHLAQLREVYDAAFTEPDTDIIDLTYAEETFEADADKPIHIRRAENIISTLYDDIAKEDGHGH